LTPLPEDLGLVYLFLYRKQSAIKGVYVQRINSGIKETILNQCQTVFLFANPNADKESYCKLFNLTDDQWAFIKGTSKNAPKRSVLVKRIAPDNNEAVILDIDLSCLGSYLKFYRSGTESVQLVNRLQKQFGREGWREPYLEAAA
jgi:type IV secretion system protein VirB4